MISWNPMRRVSVALVVALVLAVACSSSNPTSPGSTPAVSSGSSTSPGTGTTGSSGTGTLRLMLKDAPTNASAVLVTFSAISVHMSGGGWIELSSGLTSESLPLTCDLIKLRSGGILLGTGEIAAGHYTQIRLMMPKVTLYQGGTPTSSLACVTAENAATAVPVGAVPAEGSDVTVPSGDIKLNHEFTLSGGTTLTITLDFDASKSIHETGNNKFMMTPVINIDSMSVGT
jgi:Domain of unknown function (DUF4382)